MSRTDNYLFSEDDSSNKLREFDYKLSKHIESYSAQIVLSNSMEDLIENIFNEYQVKPLCLIEEQGHVDSQEVDIETNNGIRTGFIRGQEIVLEIPFTGNPFLFSCRPSQYSFNPPRGIVYRNLLRIYIYNYNHNAEEVKKELDDKLANIKKYINNINNDFIGWNNTLKDKINKLLEIRKDKILKDQGLVSSLGFPLKSRSDSVLTYAAPITRKVLNTASISNPSKPNLPEPVLLSEQYDDIINIIKKSAVMFERSPNAFKSMEEEHLRDILLVTLNSHYEGQATGETFNYNGKTDILIRVKDKNIFIAECKIWKGQKLFLEAIDQLLGYSTWRDSKLAIVVFNRNKDLSKILYIIQDVVKSHANFKKYLGNSDETTFRYIFSHKDDKNKDLFLTVMFFNVPI